MPSNTKIAILVGSGAVENAWLPVLSVLNLLHHTELDNDSANFLFAKTICALRLYSKLPEGVTQLKAEQERFTIIKESISVNLKYSQEVKILRTRKEFEAILNKFVFADPNNRFGFITTNWDTVIDLEADRLVKQNLNDNENAKVFHIHGSIKAHKQLYLPSETSMENYRSDEENKILGYKHFATYKFLLEANIMILYGISLDPLDAELSLLLSGAFDESKSIKEVIIINPDYKKISTRIKLLQSRRTDIIIRCFDPNNLDTEIILLN